DARWLAQLDDIGATVPPAGPVADVAKRSGWGDDGRFTALRDAVGLLSFLRRLPPLPLLCDPPGSPGARVAGVGADPRLDSASAKLLARVRALLAKAESTGFPEEAEALTAKA